MRIRGYTDGRVVGKVPKSESVNPRGKRHGSKRARRVNKQMMREQIEW